MSRAGKLWNEEELTKLRACNTKADLVALSKELGRSFGSVEDKWTRTRKLGGPLESPRDGFGRVIQVPRREVHARIQERNERLVREGSDPIRELLGDPPPGRSALDRYQHVGTYTGRGGREE